MTLFWILAVAMVAAAVLFILWPLWKNSERGDVDRNALNLSLIQEQYQQLERDFDTGLVSEENYRESKADLEAAVIADTANQSAPVTDDQKPKSIILLLAVSVPLCSAFLYTQFGHFDQIKNPPVAQPTQADVETMVTNLAARMEQEPDNIEGWNMLGKSYMMMRRYAEAKSVYASLLEKLPEDTTTLLNYADATAMDANGIFTGEPYQTIKKILSIDPDHVQARWMAGMAEQQAGNPEQALAIWKPLLTTVQQINPQMAAELQKMIASVGNVEPANTATISLVRLRIQVEIAPSLQGQLQPNDTLFVYARAMQGPPMPLAIQRLDANDIPNEIVLDDSTAMMPQMKLSNFELVKVDARISPSGSAAPQAGDLYGRIENIKVGTTSDVLTILISKVVE